MLYEDTTIVAIATPPGYGGIGVLRLSGNQSLLLVRQLLSSNVPLVPNQVLRHSLVHPETHQIIDDALVTYFKAPHSYTGEDVVEVSCHGAPMVLAEVLRLFVSFGAQLAQPGEFTMRAFLNQKIDLVQAEAVNDLIHSQTSYQAQLAARQLHGELSKRLKPVKDALIEMIVFFESSIEFVEDDLEPLDLRRLQRRIESLCSKVEQWISSYQFGRLVRSGIKLAIVGRPNVGKSSIFNALLGKDRAIVTNISGTTRDTLSEAVSLNGIPVELIDTAGIRETVDVIEKLGVERTMSAIADADFIIATIEAHQIPSEDEIGFLSQIPFHLLVINKADLGIIVDENILHSLVKDDSVAKVSALSGEGITYLRELIHQKLTATSSNFYEGGIITNERHYRALTDVLDALHNAQEILVEGVGEEIVVLHLHRALRSLGIITGETLIGDIINQIFSTFCIGK